MLLWERLEPEQCRHITGIFQLFLKYISTEFWHSAECVQYLCDLLTSTGDFEVVLTARNVRRYDQLYDYEENSFFAEKLYNSFVLHECLTVSCLPHSHFCYN